MLPLPLRALPESARALLARAYGGADVRFERIALSLPALAENGNSVALGVAVQPPMAQADGARAGSVVSLEVFAPENPNPRIARFHFGPACPRAEVRTRVRMAASQTVVAVAACSDGNLYAGAAEIVVTEAACLDFLF